MFLKVAERSPSLPSFFKAGKTRFEVKCRKSCAGFSMEFDWVASGRCTGQFMESSKSEKNRRTQSEWSKKLLGFALVW